MAFSSEVWRIMAAWQAVECEEDHFDPVIKITNYLRARCGCSQSESTKLQALRNELTKGFIRFGRVNETTSAEQWATQLPPLGPGSSATRSWHRLGRVVEQQALAKRAIMRAIPDVLQGLLGSSPNV
jgi:hypothetical protein